MSRARRLLLLALLVSPFAGGVAAAAEPDASARPYAVPRSEVTEMKSRGGGAYRIMVAHPEAPPPAKGYPVLYVLDGDDSFAIVAEAANRMGRFSSATRMAPGIIVAIGYPGPTRRSLDYTPAAPPAPEPGGRVEPTGGAEAFRRFIVEELRPEIERRFSIDRTRQALMGHSYGGLFVLDTLFSDPALFQTYIASSPSIWFGAGHVLTKEPGFLRTLKARKLDPLLVMTVGEHEQSPPPGSAADAAAQAIAQRNAGRRMVDNSRNLADRLSKAGVRVRYRIFSGETHGSAPLPAIGNALPHAFAPVAP